MPDGIRDLIGQQLQHYQVTAILDIGGEYRYLRAIDTSNQRNVMLVILPPKVFEEQIAFVLLKEECYRIQSLKQAHLLPIYHVGMWRNLAYVAIPPIRESLSNYLTREKHLAASRAVRTTADLAWALQALHGSGLIHGDIQPGNLLYDETGVLHLADFGITRALAREQEKPHRGHGRGTTAPLALPSPYKAPELVDPRVMLSVQGDIYSLGAILYEMVTGATPRNLQPNEPIPLPPPAESGLDPLQRNALEAALRRALARDPAERYADARNFAVALRAASGSKTMPPVRNESLTNALAGVWHVSHGPANDASAQQLIASLFSVEESEKISRMPSRPARRGTAGPDRTRARRGRRRSTRWLIAAIAVVILLIVSTVGAITVVYGNPLQILEPGTSTPQATPTSTVTATDTVSPSPTGAAKAASSSTHTRFSPTTLPLIVATATP